MIVIFCNIKAQLKHILYALLIIAFFLSYTFRARAAEISIFNVNTLNYPIIKASIYPISNSGKSISIQSKEQLGLFENNVEMPIISINCPDEQIGAELSAVLTIDISSSMDASRIDLAKNGAIEWVRLFPTEICETAISIFNHDSYLAHQFSNNKQSLIQSLDYITAWGGTNYNAALIGTPAGAITMLEDAQYKNKSIVLLTDGLSQADEKTIIDLAIDNNIKIYSIIIGMPAPAVLTTISEQTGGLWWDNIAELWEIKNIYRTILMHSLEFEPCEIVWRSNSCDDLIRVSLFADFAPSGAITQYQPPKDKRAILEFEPASHLNFPKVQKDDNYEMNITLIAKNDDIRINSIEPPLRNFTISDYGGEPPPFVIEKNARRTFKVKYSPRDTLFYFGEFNIIGELCNRTSFTASGGQTDSIGNIGQLHIISPNGLERFGILSETNILWSGTSPSDTVIITYSGNGFSWDTISNNAKGNSHRWNIPDRIGDSYLLKITQLSKDINYKNLKIYQTSQSAIRAIAMSKDGKLGISSAGNITARSAESGALLSNIATGQTQVNNLIWDESSVYIARIGEYNNIAVWNYLVPEDAHGFSMNDKRITSAAWSRNGAFLAGSSSEGRLSLWRFPNKAPEHSFRAYDTSITAFALTNNADFAAIASENGMLKLFNTQNGNEAKLIDIYNSQINSLHYSPNDDYLLVGLESSRIEIWNTTFYDLYLRINNLSGAVRKAIFSNNNIHFAVHIGNSIKIYSTEGGKEIAQYTAKSAITDFDWAFDGYRIAVGLQNGEVHIFDIRDLPYRRTIIQEDVSDDYWAIVEPKFKLNKIDFGKITVGQSLDSLFKFAIQNVSAIAFEVDSATISADSQGIFEFRTNPKGYKFNVNEYFPIELRASSQTLGKKTAALNVYSKNRIFSTEIAAEFVQPIILQSDYFIDFGKISIGERSEERAITIENVSSQLIKIDSVVMFGLFSDNFILLSDISFTIEQSSSKQIEFQFAPLQYGKQSIFAKLYYDSHASPIRVNLFGEAIAPEIVKQDTIEIRQILCNGNPIQVPIYLKNIGNGNLIIKDIEFSKYKEIIDFDNSIINKQIIPFDSLYLNISIEPTIIGDYEFTISLLTNIDRNLNVNQEIFVKLTLDSNSIEIEPSILSFDPENEFEEEIKTIFIKNNSLLSLFIDMPIIAHHFEIIGIDANPIAPLSIAEMQVKFNGGVYDSLYLANFTIKDHCNVKQNIYLSAAVGGGIAITSSVTNLLFSRETCDFSEKKQTLELSNIGNKPLIIYNIKIVGDDNFEAEMEDTNPIILPNTSKNIIITQKQGKNDGKDASLIISTNSQNDIGGERVIQIDSKTNIYNIIFALDTINFGELRENISKTERVMLYNTGDLPISFAQLPKGENFEFISIVPKTISVGGSAFANIKFNGGRTDQLYNETLVLTDSCGTEYAVNLIASVSGYPDITITIDSVKAMPGEIIAIPIRIAKIDTSIIGSIREIQTSISFNPNLLFPISPTPLGQIEAGLRTISLSFAPNADYMQPVEYLLMKAMLGDTNNTQLKFGNSQAIADIPIVVEEIDGFFELTGICSTGSLRLISSTGVLELLQNYPNPAKGETIIKFGIIEEGLHRLSIYDYLGKHIITLFEAEMTAGQYQYSLDTKILPLGTYIYLLETPSQKLTRKMQVLR